MFNFMKKATGGAVGGGAVEEAAEDKERRKREKKERKEKLKRDRGPGGVTAEELLRIDEVRRSLKLRARRKEKEKLPSGITADYSASFFAELDRDANYSNYPLVSDLQGEENNHIIIGETKTTSVVWRESLLQSDSSEASLTSLNNPNGASKQPPNLPPLPPRPPKRGILKGPRLSASNLLQTDLKDHAEFAQNGQDPAVLMQNTLRNELISYQNVPVRNGISDELNNVQNFTKKVIHSPVEGGRYHSSSSYGSPPPITVTSHDHNGQYKENGNQVCATSPSPSADTLTDTTSNSSFATPPFSMSPTGDSDVFHHFANYLDGMNLPLPEIVPAELPPPRVLTIQRQKGPRSDFGFSLRRAMIVERNYQDGTNGVGSSDDEKDGVRMKTVIFAEPGTLGQGHETGLLPGDRLLEVNSVSVDDKSRDEIIEMIKGSTDHVTVKVQPVAELSEVWRRWASLGTGSDDDSPVDRTTLSRIDSKVNTLS